MRPLGQQARAASFRACVRAPTRICVAVRTVGPFPNCSPPPLSGPPLLAPVLRVYETGDMRPLFAQLLRAKVFSETGLSPRTGIR